MIAAPSKNGAPALKGWRKFPDRLCWICKQKGSCGLSENERFIVCWHKAEGSIKPAKGGRGWVHRNPRKGVSAAERSTPARPVQTRDGPPPAPPDTLHAVYSALLGALELNEKHHADLVRRGFTAEGIDRRQFKSLRDHGRADLAFDLAQHFGRDTVLSVPGFYVNRRSELTLTGLSGLLIPVRDTESRIVAVRIRPDVAGSRKYRWLSSLAHRGPSSGTPAHVPMGTERPAATIRITEGELKAELAAERTGVPTLSAPGCSLWERCIEIARDLGAQRVRVAFDMDAWSKVHVARSLLLCCKAIVRANLGLELERWDGIAAKGIDDALVAGVPVEVLTGDAAMEAARGAARSAGVTPEMLPLDVAEIRARAEQLARQGASAVLRDRGFHAEVARLSLADVLEYDAFKADLFASCRDLKARSFERAIRGQADLLRHDARTLNGEHTEGACAPGMEENPRRLARLFLDGRMGDDGEPTLRFWRGEFHAWDGACYRPVPESEIRAELANVIGDEFQRLYDVESARGNGAKLRPVTTALVANIHAALAGLTLLKQKDYPVQPAWLMKKPPWAEASEVLPTRNALVHLPSFFSGRKFRVPPTPLFFSSFALDYDFNPDAPEPTRWIKFLLDLWPSDPESINTLQEWFGYCLTPDTSQQKILMLIGPKRSGKGTITRILTALVGESNTVYPRLAALATNFGLAPLIGKPVGIIPDARLGNRMDQAPIVESLLSISGEDHQTIDRKHIDPWNGKLPTRFVLSSNELPRLRDASGAIVSRMIVLPMSRSFFGQEDRELLGRLLPELPSILLWAIEGWQRLRERGRFIQPASGKELVDALGALSSPILAFLKECCVLGPGQSVAADELFKAWREWCQANGRDHAGDKPSFGRYLHAAIPDLVVTQPRGGASKRPRVYEGVGLSPDAAATDRQPKPLSALAKWLKEKLLAGVRGQRVLVNAAGEKGLLKPKGNGFEAGPLFEAARELNLIDDKEGNAKVWRLPDEPF